MSGPNIVVHIDQRAVWESSKPYFSNRCSLIAHTHSIAVQLQTYDAVVLKILGGNDCSVASCGASDFSSKNLNVVGLVEVSLHAIVCKSSVLQLQILAVVKENSSLCILVGPSIVKDCLSRWLPTGRVSPCEKIKQMLANVRAKLSPRRVQVHDIVEQTTLTQAMFPIAVSDVVNKQLERKEPGNHALRRRQKASRRRYLELKLKPKARRLGPGCHIPYPSVLGIL